MDPKNPSTSLKPSQALGTPSDLLAWYCFRAQPKKERIAVANIRSETNTEAFAPRISFYKKTRTGKKRFVEALFPGYVFVFCDIAQNLRHLLSMRGVSGVVKYGNKIPQLPSSMVEALREQYASTDEPIPVKQDEFEEGSSVTIVEGSLKDLEAVVLCYMPAQERIQVLVELLGRDLSITLPSSTVLPE